MFRTESLCEIVDLGNSIEDTGNETKVSEVK